MKHYYIKTFTIGATISLMTSCSSYEEPTTYSAFQSIERSTRSSLAEDYSVGKTKAIQIAAATLQKTSEIATNATPILSKKSKIRSANQSDTVAFIVNYENNGGFAIIANDTRIDNLLAYGETGNFSETNLIAKKCFLDKIEDYIDSEINSPSNSSTQTKPTRVFEILPKVDLELGPTSPFDTKVNSVYPECHAGFANVAAATIISTLTDKIVYKGHLYDFETINYALKQGYGWSPFAYASDGSWKHDPTYPVSFIYSYAGSVSAYNQLLFDIGQDTSTVYFTPKGTVTTEYRKVRPIFQTFGLEASYLFVDVKNIKNYISLLENGYLIDVFSSIKKPSNETLDIPLVNGTLSWVIDGCKIYMNDNNEVLYGYLNCVWGMFNLGDGYYSYPIIMQDEGDDEYISPDIYFGVKKQ